MDAEFEVDDGTLDGFEYDVLNNRIRLKVDIRPGFGVLDVDIRGVFRLSITTTIPVVPNQNMLRILQVTRVSPQNLQGLFIDRDVMLDVSQGSTQYVTIELAQFPETIFHVRIDSDDIAATLLAVSVTSTLSQ